MLGVVSWKATEGMSFGGGEAPAVAAWWSLFRLAIFGALQICVYLTGGE